MYWAALVISAAGQLAVAVSAADSVATSSDPASAPIKLSAHSPVGILAAGGFPSRDGSIAGDLFTIGALPVGDIHLPAPANLPRTSRSATGDLAAVTAVAAVDPGVAGITFQILMILILVLLSGAFSGSETVLFSLTPVQLERAAASHNPFRRQAAQLMRQPKQTLMTVLVANTTVNVLLFATSYVFFNRLAQQFGAWWVRPAAGATSVLLVVVGGEVVPKVLAVSLADRLAPLSAAVVTLTGFVAGPLGKLIDWLLAEPASRLLLGGPRRTTGLTTLEIKTLLDMSRRSGTIEPLEDTFLRAVIDLGHTRVREVMIPRVEVTAWDLSEPRERLYELMRRTRFKKVPVYEGSKDNIIGLIYAKILFLNPDKPLRDLIVPVRFVPEVMSCEQLLRHFRATRSQIAIVVDEYGGVAGLVTLEDVLEEIVGELHDPEEEPEEPEIRRLSDDEYEISGQLNVHHWVKTFRLPPRVERVATVGGLVMAQLGRPARVGDLVRLGNVQLKVIGISRRRIERLQLKLLSEEHRPKSL